MNPKIVKIDEEHAKNTAKIAKLQERNRELEKQRLEIENTDILGLVRSMGLDTDQLAEIIRSARDMRREETADGENADQPAEQEGGAYEDHYD